VLEVARGEAGVTVSDAGAPFDPLAAPIVKPPQSLEDLSQGRMGLVMIRRCSDWLRYRRSDGRNHLTFGARWEAR